MVAIKNILGRNNSRKYKHFLGHMQIKNPIRVLSDRAIFMAVFAYLFSKKEQAPAKFQTFSMWFMMTVPHCLSHGYPLFQSMILLVLFSLPFTVLQRKRDIASAMIAHSLVDLMRFVVFGLP